MSEQDQYYVACPGRDPEDAAESLKRSFNVERFPDVSVEVYNGGEETYLSVSMPKDEIPSRALENVLTRACRYMAEKGVGRARFMAAASGEAETLKASGEQPSVTAAIPKVARFSAS